MKKILTERLLAFFFFHTSLLLGWVIGGFVTIYGSMHEAAIMASLAYYISLQPYWIGSALLSSAIYWILRKKASGNLISAAVTHLVGWQTVFVFLLLLNYTLYTLGYHIHVLELAGFIMAIVLVLRWGTVLSRQPLPGWQHPTSFGLFLISTLLNGSALLILLIPEVNKSSILITIIAGLLVLGLLILYARFHFLSSHSQETNSMARLLMGQMIFLFGTRIIVGFFMPLVFIIYFYFIRGETVEAVIFLILAGTLLGFYLFIKTAGENHSSTG